MIDPKLEDFILHLKTSSIADKIRQTRMKVLLKDINQNRYRVKSVLTRLNDSRDISETLKRLLQEEFLSLEQYDKLKDLGKFDDLQVVADTIKDTKNGQGLKFLPRKVTDLKTNLQELLTKAAVKGINIIQKELVLAYLDELSRQKVITEQECDSIKKELCL